MNRLTSAFSGVVSGTSIGTSSDKADSISISSRHGNTPHAHDYAVHNRRTDIASAASDSVAPSPTEADFPLDSFGTQIRKVHDGHQGDGLSGLEYLYDDPRRPYFSHNASPSRSSWHFPGTSMSSGSHHESTNSTSTDVRKSGTAAHRNLAAGSSGITSSSGFSKTGSTGSSVPSSSYEDADHALPFANGAHAKNASSFASSAAVHSDADSGKRTLPSNRPYAGPDRYVKTILTYVTNPPANRKGNRGGGSSSSSGMSQTDRPLSFKSMAKGPEGSNRVALAANDALRIVAITSPPPSVSSKPTSSSPLAQEGMSSSSDFTPTGGPRTVAHGPGGARIEEVVNLWKGVPAGGVARVVNHVDWGVGAMSNKILTACSNGNFMVFDAERNRFEREVSAGHSRSMLCLQLSKTPAQGHRLLTAGADGYAKLWDLRQGKNPALMSVRHPSPIVSLVFGPPGIENASAANSYILGLENGSIFRYEWRMATRSVGRITAAHGSKAVMALEWKENGVGDREAAGGHGIGSGGWLASGGLDRTVKIWDMTAVEMPTHPYHTIHTPHPVRRLAWRPGHDTEIAVVSIPATVASAAASTPVQEPKALDNDSIPEQIDESRLEVWDVRRGHVAKYILGKASRFGETGAVTDLIWPDGDAVQTCYSNGAVVQHDIRSHFRPLDYVPRQAVAWSPQGEATVALDRWVVGEIPFDDIKPEFTDQALPFPGKAVSDPPFSTRQVAMTLPAPHLSDEVFRYLAYAYRTAPGEDTAETCEWNATCASEVEAYHHQRLWLLVKQLFQRQQEHPVPNVDGRVGAIAPLSVNITGEPRLSAFDSAPPTTDILNRTPVEVEPSEEAKTSEESVDSTGSMQKPKVPQQAVTMADLRSSNHKRRASSSSSSSGSDSPPLDDATRTPVPGKLQLGSMTPSIQDSHLSDANAFRFAAAVGAKTNTPMKSPLATALAKLPHVASNDGDEDSQSVTMAPRPLRPAGPLARPSLYQGRDEINKSETASTIKISPSIHPAFSRRPSDMSALPLAAMAVPQTAEERRREAQRLRVLGDWRVFHVNILRKAYTATLEQGETQTACAIYLVAGHVLGLSDEEGQMLVEAYLDQLDRRRLSGVAASIRRNYKGTQSLTLSETVIQSRCGRCRKSVEFEGSSANWFCESCKAALSACVVCHLPVKGLYTGCSKCTHGGHETCMRDVEVRNQPKYFYDCRTPLRRTHSPSLFNHWRQTATPGKRYNSPNAADYTHERASSRGGPPSSTGDPDQDAAQELNGTTTWDANSRSCVTGCGCVCNNDG